MNLSESVAALLGRWTALEPDAATLVARLVALGLTIVVLVAAYRLLARLVERLAVVPLGVPLAAAHAQRVRTLAPLLTSVARWGLAFVGLVIVLGALGVDVRALLVSAGVLGVAVGLGAQTLVRDVIAGVFLLFEGLVAVGDEVQVGDHAGTVEAIGLRVTQLRLLDGALRVVPNGQLAEFTNRSRGWARATVDVMVPRDADLDRALAALRRAGEEWAAASGAALAPPETHGIMGWSGGDVQLRLMVKVDPSRRLEAEAALRRRVNDGLLRDLRQAPAG
ncbi:MAG: mechanosensitive ion channel family protein [Candidatus Rokubacteria bacterium]|nr:mechanosensitive ion channel family protein [Candidatus Rokubacteria bacterium]MBI3827533.1 mechanosensitive ion channel family protein [Candidatus Rokubacteria bacterium]